MIVDFVNKDADVKVVAVVKHLSHLACNILMLPETLAIEFQSLPGGVHAQSILSHRFRNRIVLNNNLSETEIMLPLIHELIHIQQQKMGYLKCLPSGVIIYKNQHFANTTNLSWDEYCNLPWEIDAFSQQLPVLKRCLEMSKSKS